MTVSERGTGLGSVASPLLANIYLHYVFDLWAERWRRQEATGGMIIVRYADDLVLGFQHESDAHRFLDAMCARFEEFAIEQSASCWTQISCSNILKIDQLFRLQSIPVEGGLIERFIRTRPA